MKNFLTAAAVAACLVIGCGEGDAPNPSNDSPLGVVTAATYRELPFCWFARRAQVFYVSSTEQFFYCNGRKFVALDLDHTGGEGTTWVVNVAPASLAECPNGGALISSGPDANGDGVVDSVASSQSVCDGVDGTSCTVARDDASATTTVTCEDGTVATVADGEDGPPGPDGEPGHDGTSCSVETDAGGVVTIACDDGTSATVAPGGGSDGVGILCELVRINRDIRPIPELSAQCPKAESCPCFTEEDVISKLELDPNSVLGCVWYNGITETIPSQNGANAAFEARSSSGPTPYFCDTSESGVFSVTYEEHNRCVAILEDTVGPCKPRECVFTCDDDDGNPCTDELCDTTTFSCVSEPKANGSSCELDGGGTGQCRFGRCQPVLPTPG